MWHNASVSGGGGGVWAPKGCAPKMARPDGPNGKCHVFPRWSLWSRGGGVQGYPPPPSSCGVQPFYYFPDWQERHRSRARAGQR